MIDMETRPNLDSIKQPKESEEIFIGSEFPLFKWERTIKEKYNELAPSRYISFISLKLENSGVPEIPIEILALTPQAGDVFYGLSPMDNLREPGRPVDLSKSPLQLSVNTDPDRLQEQGLMGDEGIDPAIVSALRGVRLQLEIPQVIGVPIQLEANPTEQAYPEILGISFQEFHFRDGRPLPKNPEGRLNESMAGVSLYLPNDSFLLEQINAKFIKKAPVQAGA